MAELRRGAIKGGEERAARVGPGPVSGPPAGVALVHPPGLGPCLKLGSLVSARAFLGSPESESDRALAFIVTGASSGLDLVSGRPPPSQPGPSVSVRALSRVAEISPDPVSVRGNQPRTSLGAESP